MITLPRTFARARRFALGAFTLLASSLAIQVAAPAVANAQTVLYGRDASTGGARPVNEGPDGMLLQNTDSTLLASAAQTATFQTPDQANYTARGVRLYLVISAASGTSPTLDCKVQEKDPASSNYIDVPGASWTQKTSTNTGEDLVLFPGATVTANRSISTPLPRTWRVNCTIGGTTPSFTMSFGMTLIK